jgi:hypothetical protein
MNNSLEVIMGDNIGDSGLQNYETNHIGDAPPPPPTYVDPHDRAKLRKIGDNQNNLATTTVSKDEDLQAQ